MKIHTKTVFVLLGTLAIGIAVGALGQSAMHNRRMEKLAEMRRQGGLYGQLDRYIDATDQVQEDSLRAITHRHQDRMDNLYKRYRWIKSGMMDSLKTEIGPVLDSTQNQALDQFFERATRRPENPWPDSTARRRNRAEADSTR